MSEYGQLICSFLTLTTHDRDLHQASATWLRKKRTHFGINEVAMKPRLGFVLAFFPFFFHAVVPIHKSTSIMSIV